MAEQDLDEQLNLIIGKIEVEYTSSNPSPDDIFTLTISGVPEAKAKLKTLVAEQVVAGQIAELERIDGFAYGTDYGEYQADRIQVLRSKNESN